MINKANDGIPEPIADSGNVDIVNIDVQCHLLIKDKDTGEVLVSKRG